MKNNFSKQWDAGGGSRSIIQSLNLFTSRNLFKSLKSILMVVALLSLSSNVWGTTVTYSASSMSNRVWAISTSGTAPTGSSVSCTQTYSNTFGQATDGNSFTMTLSNFSADITKLTFSLHSNSSNGKGNLGYSVDGGSEVFLVGTSSSSEVAFNQWGDNTTYGSNYRNVNFSVTISPKSSLVINVRCAGKNSIYFNGLTITYTVAAADPYTVTFNAGSGTCSTSSSKEASAGAGVTLPTASPSSSCATAGWTFAGWKETSAQTETTSAPTLYAAGSNYKPSANCTLYAVYKITESGGNVFSKYQQVSLNGAIADGQYLISTGSYTMAGSGKTGASFTPGTTEATAKEYTITTLGNGIFTIKGPDNNYIGGADGTSLTFSNTTPSTNAYKWKYNSTGIQNQAYTTRYIRAYGTTDFRHYTTSNGTTTYLYQRVETSGSVTTYYSNPDCGPSTYTVNFAVNQVGYGTVSRESLADVASGTSISANGATLTVGSTDIEATPATNTAQYTYTFNNWTWNPTGSTITAATTATATFTRTTRSYNVTKNLSNCSVSSGSIPATVAYGGIISATISANSGYSLPDEITVSGGTPSWNKTTGALSITNVTGDVSITITAVANANYYITGASGLTGCDWCWYYDGAKFINNKVTFTNIAAGNYQFKVSNGSSLIGGHSYFDGASGTASKSSQSGWDNAQVTLSCASDITFTLLDNQHVTALGVPTTCYVAGDGSGNWCGGKNWDAAGSVMTKNNGVHSVTFTNVAAGDYQFKVTNGTWNVTYGYSSADAGCSNTTLSDAGGNDHNVGFSTTIASDITITFDGTKICVTVEPYNTVQFSNNGQASATSMPANQYVPTGGKVSEPSAPSLSGYGFGGWYKEQACTNAWNFSTDVVSTNTTLYAKWNPTLTVASVGDVDITATAQGGSAIVEGSHADVDYNKTVTLNYSNLTNGKVLTWKVYKTGDESTTVSVSGTGDGATFTMPAYPVTVAATIADLPTWTITLNTGSGELVSGTTEIVVVQGQSTTLPSCEIECEDTYGEWEFAGWKTGSNVGTITTNAPDFVATEYTPTDDITLYAVYQAVDASGGSESKSSAASLGTGSSDYWGGLTNYSALNGKYIKFTCPANATSINEIQITANSFWADAGRMTITNNTKGTTVVSSFGPIKDNNAHTVLSTSVAVSAGDEIRFTGSGGTCNAKRIYVEWTETSSITRYWSIPCNEKYTMTFHGVGGDASTIDWDGSLGSEDDYIELNATTITAYPTCATAETGWTFLGWRTSNYNDGKTLDDESASTDDPDVNSIYKNGKGFALNSGTTSSCGDGVRCVDMYPVFTKFVENEKPDIANLASGSKYYMYYTSDAAGYQDAYSSLDDPITTRIYAHEFSSNAFSSTTTCASAQLFEFTKRADGNWDIRMRNAADDGYESHSYIYAGTATDNTDLYAQAAQPDYGWVIEAITIGGKTMVKMQYAGNTNTSRFMKVYDGGGSSASGTFKYYSEDCATSTQYHAIYLGSCSNRIFSSNPGHATTWEVYGDFTDDGTENFVGYPMTNGMVAVPNLAANTTYQFKLRKTTDDGAHYTDYGATASNNNYDASGVEWILNGESGGHYVNLATGVAGDYTFIASRMSATFPGITVTYPTAYTITFDGNGNDDGSMAAMTNLAMGEEISLTANEFTKTCNDFVEWNTNQDGTGTPYIDGHSVTVSGNMTLYAQWTLMRFDAIYDANGVTGYTGELPATVTYDCGDQVTIDQSKTLSKFGYTFIGWNTNPAATTPQPDEYNPFTIDHEDTRIYAIWNAIKPTEIAIEPATGGSNPVKGTGVQMIVTLTPDASTMAEENREVTWSSSDAARAFINQQGQVSFVGTGDVTITATSNVDSSIKGTYTFHVQAGTCDGLKIHAYGPGYQEDDYFHPISYGANEWRCPYVLKNGGDHFWVGDCTGWQDDHSEVKSFNDIPLRDYRTVKTNPAQDLVGTLVIWNDSKDKNYGICFEPTYMVSYMTDASNWRIMEFYPTSMANSYETELLQVPEGYKNNSDMKYYVGLKKANGDNVSIYNKSSQDAMNGVNGLSSADIAGKYGKWHIWSNSGDNNWCCEFNRYYQVRFEMNGGDGNIDPMYFYANDTESFNTNTLTNPTKTGYNLTGWKDQEDNTYTTSESITVTKDLVLTAQWTARNYTITYNGLEGASNTNPGTYTIETPTITLQDPGARTGYEFVGWFDAATDGNPVTCIPLGSTGDVIVWAHWNANSYSVTLHKNTEDVGSTDGSATFVYNTSAPTSYVAATRNGYDLNGYWTTAGGGTQVLDNSGNVTANSLSSWKTDGKWTRANNDGILHAHWKAIAGIDYYVYHYKMNVDGTYPSEPTAQTSGKGHTDEVKTNLKPNDYEGFVTPAQQNLTIVYGGENILRYYYERNKYELTWDFDGGTPTGDYTQGQVYHGATIKYPTNVTKDGCAFMRWDVNPATMPMEATTITAQWAEYTNYRTYCGDAVTFYAQNGTEPEQTFVVTTDNNKITTPTLSQTGFAQPEGWVLLGWTKVGGDPKVIVEPSEANVAVEDGDEYNAVWTHIAITGNVLTTSAVGVQVGTTIHVEGTTNKAYGLRVSFVDTKETDDTSDDVTYGSATGQTALTQSDFRLANTSYTYIDDNIIRIESTAAGDTHSSDYNVVYTPKTANVIDNYVLKIQVMKTSSTALDGAVYTLNLKGRALPENFVIAENRDSKWYALPADMNSSDTYAGKEITVEGTGMNRVVTNATLDMVYSMKTYNNDKSHVLFQSQFNQGHLWAASGDYTGIKNDAKTVTGENSAYSWMPTPQDATLDTYVMSNVNNNRTLAMNGTDFGMYSSFGTNIVYFIPLKAEEYEEKEMMMVEWFPTKVLVEVDEDVLTGARAKINNVEVADVAASDDTYGTHLYEITGLNTLVDNAAKKLTILYTKEATTYGHEFDIPVIVSNKTYILSSSKAENKFPWTQAVYNTADLVVRDTSVLTVDGATAAANTFGNVTIYPKSKVVVPEGKTMTTTTTTLFGGTDEIYDGSAYTLTKYIVPQLVLNGTLVHSETTSGLVYDVRVDKAKYYNFALPYTSKYELVTDNKGGYDYNYWVKVYNGQTRVETGNGWVYYDWDADPWALNIGTGYMLEAQSTVGQNYVILRHPLGYSNTGSKYAQNTCGHQSGTVEATKAAVNVTAPGMVDGEIMSGKTANNVGWNFIANPFMANFQLDQDGETVGTIQVGHLEEHIEGDKWNGKYDWNTEEGKNVRYVTLYNNGTDTYTQLPMSEAVLAPFTGFFVQIAKEGTIVFDINGRADKAPARMLNDDELPSEMEVKLKVNGQNESDETVMLLTKDLHRDNAREFPDEMTKQVNAGTLNFYTYGGETKMFANGMSYADGQTWSNAGLMVAKEGSYTFSVTGADNEHVSHVILRDKYSNTEYDLKHTDAEIYLEAGEVNDRFDVKLVLDEHGVTTELDNVRDNNNPEKFIYNDKMFIRVNGRIYDATGKRVNK